MQDYSKIKTKIQALKAIIAKDGITPVYLGSLLDDIADLISAAESSSSQNAQSLVSSERAAREVLESKLSKAISDERTIRKSEDSSLYDAIGNERSARMQADTLVREAVSDEQSARMLADGLLQHDIDSEVSARTRDVESLESADASIRSDLGSEASIRAGADNELRASIALLRSAVDSLERDLDSSEEGTFAQSVIEDIREAYSKISTLADDLRTTNRDIDVITADISHLTPLLLASEEEHTRLVEEGKIDPEQMYYTVEEE